MKLHNAVQDKAIVSNVGEIGEFRIRNSAKAFNILSSGLYANKIRAIIRELSCNAIDSHVAAGKTNTPYDVHLPNQLEPHFSIRDYGTGLSHEQVINIYTTYFESTKTNSNEYIGALGLGSKSPFAYTDNFTVTAIQNNKKGIYTAFINEQGVPSIALMMEEETTDPNGVEVKFSVNDRYDYEKFKSEARKVYQWFKYRPVISGVSNFEFENPKYETMDIIKGVHSLSDSRQISYAIMGNIAYPIEVPEADNTLGELRSLLKCGLVMEFDIGELDFQASREGLSYIPQTIQSIKKKLKKLNDQLYIHIKDEADKIENIWLKTFYLKQKNYSNLWCNAVVKYIKDTNYPYNPVINHYGHTFVCDIEVLKTDYNVTIRAFQKTYHYETCNNVKISQKVVTENDIQKTMLYYNIQMSDDTRFVVNNTKVGVLERAKYHVKHTNYLKNEKTNHVVMYVLEPFDKTKPIDINGFKQFLSNPPENYFLLASELSKKDINRNMGKNVSIMCLEEKSTNSWRRRGTEYVWRDAGKADSFGTDETYYYIPLSGYKALNRYNNVRSLVQYLNCSDIHKGTVYGVRKSDIEYIKTQTNWVEVDTLIVEKLKLMDKNNIMGLVKQSLDISDFIKYNSSYINKNSPYMKLVNDFVDVKNVDVSKRHAIEYLAKMYNIDVQSPQHLIEQLTKEYSLIKQRYPLLNSLGYSTDKIHVAEYINLIDQCKGI